MVQVLFLLFSFAATQIMCKSQAKNLAAEAPLTAAERRTLPLGYFVNGMQTIFVKLDWKPLEERENPATFQNKIPRLTNDKKMVFVILVSI